MNSADNTAGNTDSSCRMNAEGGNKIFVISLHRTMTRSTDILLSMLGYSTLHLPKFYQGRNLMEHVRGKEYDHAKVMQILAPVFASRDAFSDVPVPGLYRQLSIEWPESRFILVTRDPCQWAKSVHGLMKKRTLSPYDLIQYRQYMPRRIRRMDAVATRQLAEVHERHTETIVHYFNEVLGSPDRLCHVDIREDRPGERICGFLGHDEIPLPHLTGRPSDNDLKVSRTWVEACPEKSDAHYFLARNLRHLGKLEKAESHLRRAIEVEPDQPKPYAELSDLLWSRGCGREAKKFAQSAIALGLSRPRLYKRMARHDLRHFRLHGAVRYWADAVRISIRKRHGL